MLTLDTAGRLKTAQGCLSPCDLSGDIDGGLLLWRVGLRRHLRRVETAVYPAPGAVPVSAASCTRVDRAVLRRCARVSLSGPVRRKTDRQPLQAESVEQVLDLVAGGDGGGRVPLDGGRVGGWVPQRLGRDLDCYRGRLVLRWRGIPLPRIRIRTYGRRIRIGCQIVT